jgi:hypothetical protein
MTIAKDFAGTAIGLGSIGLAVSMLPKTDKKGNMKPMNSKKMVKNTANLLVGTALLSGAASAANSL